jgi:hypothetical protein
MKKLLTVGAALWLTGCAGHPLDCSMGIPHGDCAAGTPGYYAGVGREDQCSSYGFTPGTEGYANCRMQTDQANQQRRAAVLGAIIQNNQASAAQQQANLLAEQRALSAAAQGAKPAAPTDCTTTLSGDQAYTHCH